MPSARQLETEFEQLSLSIRQLENEVAEFSVHNRANKTPPTLLHFDELPAHTSSELDMKMGQRQKTKRKEIEARRFSGKESVVEYLLQFELTAKRNEWSDCEKSSSLLCALDGPARNILAEFDDVTNASYADVKQALLLRFGPTNLTEVHEQALGQLRLARGQAIREMASEVQRLIKLAYPDINGSARDRLAVKSLIKTIPDRETAFYVKEKSPATLTEVCTLYERYLALTHDDSHQHRHNAVKQAETVTSDDRQQQQQQVLSAIAQMAEATNCRLNKLAETVAAQAANQQAPPNRREVAVPRKPCPRCKQQGHWARDCSFPSAAAPCYSCGQPGHYARDCQSYLNGQGPTQASNVGPQTQRMF